MPQKYAVADVLVTVITAPASPAAAVNPNSLALPNCGPLMYCVGQRAAGVVVPAEVAVNVSASADDDRPPAANTT